MAQTLYELINGHAQQPELVTLGSGFLTLPGTNLSRLTVEELSVLVHPFNPRAYVNNGENPDYEGVRDELVRGCRQPVLMGLEDDRLPISAAWLQALNPQGPRIIYLTDYAIQSQSDHINAVLLEG